MGSGYQIDVVGSLFLKTQENLCQPFRGEFFAQSFLTDLIILAETAFQTAAGEEHRAASSGAAECRALPSGEEQHGQHRMAAFSPQNPALSFRFIPQFLGQSLQWVISSKEFSGII